MINKDNVLELLTHMISNSPKKRLEAIRIFILKSHQDFTILEFNELIKPLEDKSDQQIKIGQDSMKKKTMKYPAYKAFFKGIGICGYCKKHLTTSKDQPGPAFFQVVKGEWKVWHAEEKCFPEEYVHMMKAQLKKMRTP